MDSIIKTAYKAACTGRPYAFATVTSATDSGTPRKAGAKMIVFADGSTEGTIGGGVYELEVIRECQRALKQKKPKIVTYELKGKTSRSLCGGTFAVFIEPFVAQQRLVICGGGHIALPLSFIGKLLNFEVVLIDQRPEYAGKNRFPHVDTLRCGPYAQTIKSLTFRGDSCFVIVTPGHTHDWVCLKAALRTPARYVGVIGSAQKRQKFLKKLQDTPRLWAQRDRIRMPVGLDIGAQTPDEIAVSIAAEIVADIHRCDLQSAKFIIKDQEHNRRKPK